METLTDIKKELDELKKSISTKSGEQIASMIDSIGQYIEMSQISTIKGVKNDLNEMKNLLLQNMLVNRQVNHNSSQEIHKHIDMAQRDILIALDFVRKHQIELRTKFPVAIESLDHIYPLGTMNDNTRCPRFIRKCESLFPVERDLKFLDLGCSGGGVVLDACLKGHIGIGLEGSDFSILNQRAEWRLLKDNLFTCDVLKDFELYDNETKDTAKFDIISAWEVLEHLPAEKLEMFFKNVEKHLVDDGYFVASVSLVDSIDPKTNINLHCTVKPREWWYEKIDEFGFENNTNLFTLNDYSRGSGNNPIPWSSQVMTGEINETFHIVLTKKK